MASHNAADPGVTSPPTNAAVLEKSSQDVDNGTDKSDSGKAGEEIFIKQSITTITILTTTSLMAMFLIALDRTIITTVRQ
jgi:hypothetical protein